MAVGPCKAHWARLMLNGTNIKQRREKRKNDNDDNDTQKISVHTYIKWITAYTVMIFEAWHFQTIECHGIHYLRQNTFIFPLNAVLVHLECVCVLAQCAMPVHGCIGWLRYYRNESLHFECVFIWICRNCWINSVPVARAQSMMTVNAKNLANCANIFSSTKFLHKGHWEKHVMNRVHRILRWFMQLMC